MVDDAFASFKKEIDELKYDFQFNKILYFIKDQNKWADSKVVMNKISAKQIELLGEKPKDDGKRKNKNKMSNEEKKQHKVNAPKDPEAVASSGRDILETQRFCKG